MKYDFNKVIDRRNTDCIKWDLVKKIFGNEDFISMGIADMDFPAATPIVEALKKRIDHPFYGYTLPGSDIVEAIVERTRRKFGWEIKPEWIAFTAGVIPALHAAVRSLTHPGDEIIVQKPVYPPFFKAVTSNGCKIVDNNLKLINNCYEMDFANLESNFLPKTGMFEMSNRIRAVILCNPHNPVGRVWSKDELTRLGEIAIKYGTVVISDEIHCEIMYRGNTHIPFASISKGFEQNCIVCMSPSKTFNLAGLEISYAIIPNDRIREDFKNQCHGISPAPNLLGFIALKAAYKEGDDWLNQLLEYLQENRDFLLTYFNERIPQITVIPPQGTYMVWLDCRKLNMDNHDLGKLIKEKMKIEFFDGSLFGNAGDGFQRMNIACPRPILEEALRRIEMAVNDI